MKKATSKFESLYTRIQIDNERPTQRVIYVPWDVRTQVSGIFYFKGGKQSLKLWLPKGVKLDYIQIQSDTPPPIPDHAVDYIPPYTPPPGRDQRRRLPFRESSASRCRIPAALLSGISGRRSRSIWVLRYTLRYELQQTFHFTQYDAGS